MNEGAECVVSDVTAGYGRITVLREVSLRVSSHEALAVLGPNGVGKTTLMRTIAGVLPLSSGEIYIASCQHDRSRRIDKIGWVPEGRQLLQDYSVRDNLHIAARAAGKRKTLESEMAKAFDLFPVLSDRISQKAGSLSGGQQQMLAIARAMVRRPSLLLLDEPSMGLAPLAMDSVVAGLKALRSEGQAMLIAEQNISYLAELVDRIAILRDGCIVVEGTRELLSDRELIRQTYLG